MSTKEIIIDIKNTIDVTNTNSNVKQAITPTPQPPIQQAGNIQNKNNGINSNFVVSNTVRTLNTIAGDNEIVQGISKTAQYGLQAKGALKGLALGNIAGAVGFAISLALEAISQAKAASQKEAAYLNSIDQERMSYGLIDMTNVKISSNWWSGRFEFERKEK